MPRIPAVPGTLKRAYSQSRLPKPRESYGNDLLDFAVDRWGRINKAADDLQALDDYAVQRRAYGGYNRQFIADPPFRNKWPMDRGALRPFVRPEYLERFDNASPEAFSAVEELADVYEYGLPEEMDRLSYPGTERYLETGTPEEGSLPRRFVDEANEDLRSWYNANWRDPSDYPSRNFRDYEGLNWDDQSYYR